MDPENFVKEDPDNAFLVINVFHRGQYGPPSRSNLTLGPITSQGVSVPEVLRKPIARGRS